MASVAMKFYKEKFLKHDKDRFEEYLQKVKQGKSSIAAGALLPHEIITPKQIEFWKFVRSRWLSCNGREWSWQRRGVGRIAISKKKKKKEFEELYCCL